MPRSGLAREAFEQGKTRYFTNLPCKHGHITERMVANGCCCECMRLRRTDHYERVVKPWRAANPGKVAEQARRYRAKHPETHERALIKYRAAHFEEIRKRARENQKRIRKSYPEREKERLKRFSESLSKKRESEAGRPKPDLCEICGELNIRIVFDHCHARGHFRGWICDRCNKVLGLVKDSPELLSWLQKYLTVTTQ
jgi:hypothetical protein